MISVILPVYNSADTIKKCITSVLEQTYTKIELLVVYLNSSDNTLDVIQSFKDNRIKIFYQTEKTGPGGARNIGLDNVSGKYVGFIEADDYIPNDFYENLYNSLIKNDCDISVGQIVQPYDGNKERYISKFDKEGVYTNFKDKISIMSNGASFNKLFKMDIIKQNNISFTEKYRFEDNPFLVKALYFSKKMSVTNKTKYYYGSCARPFSEEYWNILAESLFFIISEIMNFIEKEKLDKKTKQKVNEFIFVSMCSNRLLKNEKLSSFLKEVMGEEFFLPRYASLKYKHGLKMTFCQKNAIRGLIRCKLKSLFAFGKRKRKYLEAVADFKLMMKNK